MASSSTVAPADDEDETAKQLRSELPPPYSPGNYDPNQMTMYGTNNIGPGHVESYSMQTMHPVGPAMVQPSAVLVTGQPIPSTVQYGFGDTPVVLVCPYCNSSVVTLLRYETGAMTWTIFACLMLCLCWLCAWIPFVSHGCKDVAHICPRCSKLLGVYKRF